MKTFKAILALLLPGMVSAAASAAQVAPATLTQTGGGTTVVVTALSPNIVRVDHVDKLLNEAPRMESLTDGDIAFSGKAAGGNTLTTTAGIIVSVNSKTGAVTIDGGTPESIVVDNGLRRNGTISLATTAEGSFYGAGERGHKLNLRGDTLVQYNRQNYGYTGSDPRISQMGVTMPLFLSDAGFAIVFDDFSASKMILGNPIKYISESRKPVSYYYVGGAANLAELTQQLTLLTGRQPIAPLWALGYITSKYGYHTQAETEGVIDTLKRAGYPVDGIVLDLYWYGKEQDMGRLDWEPSQWPNPAKMLAGLKKKGVRLIPISQPYVLRNGKGLDNYNMLSTNGMLVRDSLGKDPQEVTIWVGEGGMLDVSNPDTRAWLAKRYKELTDMGVTGWWGDLGEPEVHPETAIHANGLTAREYHNKYGNDWSEIIYDMFRENYPDTRLMTMMRAGTTGLQKYSVYPWSTDVSRSWGGLEPQVRIMLNSGLSGLGYMSHDVGGFAIDPEHPYDPELYVRWLQLGLFSPVLRTHAQATAEPYNYPEQQDIIKNLIKDRYRWLPYNYTLAYENATKGWPAVRPLNFHGGAAYDSISDEFLWGRDVLVAPVMTAETTERTITFPEGSTWMDFSNPNRRYQGGETITYPAPLDVLPLFVRAGAFIPMADYPMQNTDDYRSDQFTVHYYPEFGSKSTYSLYDDNHVSATAIEKGNYRLINFEGSMAEDKGDTKVRISTTGTYPGAPTKIRMRVIVHGVPSGTLTAGYEGAKGNITINKNDGSATFDFTLDPSKPVELKLGLVPGPRMMR